MDIIITGEQGAGKTAAAEDILHPGHGRRFAESDILYVHDAYFTPGLITEMLRAARVRAVVFDGCITKPAELLACVAAVKEYRKQINADILAIYVAPGEAVMLTDGVPALLNDVPDTILRSDRLLAQLWDGLSEIVDASGAAAMVLELTKLASAAGIGRAGETAGLHHLDSDGKIAMHEFLLKLLRNNE